MIWKEWIDNWSMSSLKIKTSFLETEWKPKDADKDAAWELYIELLTRITTQPLPDEYGDEKTTLDSIYKIFGLTREAIKKHGRSCNEFAKIAIVILNQRIRPFTAKWHKEFVEGSFDDENKLILFRIELKELQNTLKKYTKMLADMSGVEDLTDLENISGDT
jgi:hypothetical protein